MIKTHCPICGPNTPYEVVYKENFREETLNKDVFSARRLPDRIHYQIVRCQKCNLVYSNPVLEEEKIKNLYEESKLTYHDEIDYIKKTYSYYLKKIINLLPSKKNFLEVGCGNGFFLEEAMEMGFENVFGVEPSIDAAQRASELVKDKIVVDVLRKGLFDNNLFDIVCIFQTLDHINKPNEFLSGCYDYLREDGIILVINHDIGAWTSKVLGERSPIIDIEHPILYDKNTFRKIFSKSGFKIINVFDVKNDYPLYYWIRLAPLPKALKKILIKIFSSRLLKNVKFSFNAGNIGIVAKK